MGGTQETEGNSGDWLGALYGRRNYPCPHVRGLRRGNPKATADGAPCTYLEDWPKECPRLAQCPYYAARHKAQVAATSVTTLAYAVLGVVRGIARTESRSYSELSSSERTESVLGPGWTKRALLIVDEAHGLAEDLVSFYAAEVGKDSLPGFDFKGIGKSKDPLKFMQEQLPPYLDRLVAGLRDLRVSEGGGTASELRALEEQHRLITRVERLIENLSRSDVVWVHTFDPESPKHKWRPLSPAPFAKSMWDQADRILLSSATFFGFETLVSDLGLPGLWAVVSMPDTFPPSSAPIHLVGSLRLSRDSMRAQLPKLVGELTRLAGVHSTERGIVHCNSYMIRDFIERNAGAALSRRMVFHTRENRVESLERWKVDGQSNSIFVGVAMSEGLDLMGDIARWQVIVKAPFPNLGDPWVVRRRDEPGGRAWYTQQAVIDILQACGRIMRSKDDHGSTYVLDANAGRIVSQNWSTLPEWFKMRVQASRRGTGESS